MTSRFRKALSAVLALLMVISPLTAYMEDGLEYEETLMEEPTEVFSEPPAEEPVVTEPPATEPPAAEVPAAEEPTAEPQADEGAPGGEEQVPGGEDPQGGGVQQDVVFDDSTMNGGFGGWNEGPSYDGMPESTPVPTPEPVLAVSFDMSHVVDPVCVPYGTPESELPLPAMLPVVFSNGLVADVSVFWRCTGNTLGGLDYIPDCEQYDVRFYFQATPVGINNCDPGMFLPTVTVVYEPQAEPTDHEGIHFQGTDIVVTGSVTTDDILNESGYDPSYRIVNAGAISAGESGRAIPNPVLLTGAIAGGTFNGRIESENGVIRGGRFNGDVGGPNGNILATIEGGEFRGSVGDGDGAGCVTIEGGAFYGDVSAYSLAVGDRASLPVFYNAEGERGAQRIVTAGKAGVIAAGVFYAAVRNAGTVAGGEFHSQVSNRGAVLGGAFLADFENLEGGRISAPEGGARGAAFPNAVNLRNSGTIDAGDAARFCADMIVTNSGGGTIASGTFPCRVENYGTISGGTYAADVVNMGAIYGGDFRGKMYNEGGTIAVPSLGCMLMSNTGLITLRSIVTAPEERVVTIAAGTTATTNDILAAIEAEANGGSASEYTIRNEGEINGGNQVLSCDFDAASTGDISGGAFSGTVYAGEIRGGTFTGAVRAKSVTAGEFGGRVNVENTISGGGFAQDSVVTAGVISGGTYWGRITSAGRVLAGLVTITGGTFNGGVATESGDGGVVINGGVFNGDVGYCADAARDIYDGYVLIRKRDGVAEPQFNGSYVGGHNVVTECGAFSENTKVVMYSMGSLAGGVFRGPVICHNAILGGTFYGDVTVNSKPNGQIHGGTFYGRVHNKEGAYISQTGYNGGEPPRFLGGEIENEGVMDPGDGAEFGPGAQIINQPTGVIRSGVYNAPVRNLGAIARGTFKAPVTTMSSISFEGPTFEAPVIDVPEETITIPEGVSWSIAEIKALEGYGNTFKIVNLGTITGGDGDALPNDVENRGVIQGGKFTGTVALVGYEDRLLDGGRIRGGTFDGVIHSYYGVISGGTFNGNVELDGEGTLVVTITGGTFNGTVGRSGDGYVFVYRADDSKKVLDEVDPSGPVFYQKVAARNLNITCGTFNGPVEMSTVGVIANGLFNGPVVCHNTITGGEFCETVEVCEGQNSHIEGGLFHKGTTIENGTSVVRAEDTNGETIAFDGGEIVNSGILDPGDDAEFGEDVIIHNTETGRILSGVYLGAVKNEGMISGATFFGAVENHSRIVNSVLNGPVSGPGTSTVEGVTVEGNTITVASGATISASQFVGLIPAGANLSDYIIVNNGTIQSGSASIPCAVYGGTITGGTYTGAVCVRKITGGTFTGTAFAQTITNGTFSGTVYAKAISGGTFNGAVHDYCNDSIGGLPADLKAQAETYLATDSIPATKGGLGIGGGSFNGTVGGSGESVFVRGGDFEGCRGLTAYNLTVGKGLSTRFGPGCAVEFTVGDIAGGSFAGAVTNNNSVTGGTFDGSFVNRGTVFGGTFNGGIDNYGEINGGATYSAYADWTFDKARSQWVPQGEKTEQRVTESDVTINCTLINNAGGVVVGTVKAGDGYRLDDRGGKFETSALVAMPSGESRIYSGERILCGAPVLATLAAIDAAERLNSKWTYLDGSSIDETATISVDPSRNAFLREFEWDIQGGELQLSMDWSEAEPPKAEYSSVRILAGTNVSGGEWNVPVINEGNITGGTFNKGLINFGSVSGATLNGEITASAGTIENCTYGKSASVASVAPSASILVNITVNGEEKAAAYGAKALEVLNAIQKRSGYEWRFVGGAEKAVGEADTISLAGGKYELRECPIPAIIWPTASDICVGEPLSASVLTSADENGTFRWKYSTHSYNTPGTIQSAVIFTPNPGNPYNYADAGIETTRTIPVQVRDDIIKIAVNSCYKAYSNADPTNMTAKVIGGRSDADRRNLKYRFVREPGEDVGTYALTVEVTQAPANHTINIIPGTFEIRPKDINSDFFRVTMKGATYTGEELSPVPTVVDLLYHETELECGKDFTVAFDRPVLEPGEYGFTVNGIGNYAGSKRGALSVGPGSAVVAIQSCTKTYGDPDPEFTSTCTGVSEKAGLQYELYRIEGENVGTYSILARKLAGDSVQLTSKGGTLKIVPKQIPNQVSVATAPTYTGSAIEVKPVVRDGDRTLVEGVDYTLSYENNIDAGTATVIVTGMGNYTGTQRASFTIDRADAEIRANDASKPLGAKDPALTATVTGALKGQTLNYTLKRESGEQIGTYAITATPGSNPNYDVAVKPAKFEITPEPTSVKFDADAIVLDVGESGRVLARPMPEGTASAITYTIDSSAVASVAADGSVRGLKAGAATVTARTENGLTATCRVTVLPKPEDVTVAVGAPLTLTPADGSAANCTFESKDKSVATVNGQGAVTALKAGDVEITASANGALLARWNVHVAAAPTKLTLSTTWVAMGLGEGLQLTATPDTDAPGEITWGTSKPKIATVDANGVVYARKKGTAVITARCYNGVYASCTVSVQKAPTSISLSAWDVYLGYGDKLPLYAYLSKKSASAVTFESSNPSVADMRDGMIVAGQTRGVATITARTFNGRAAACRVTVLPAPTSVSLGADFTVGAGQGAQLVPTMNSSDCKASFTYESSDPNAVSVNAAGYVVGLQAGRSATITATSHNGISGSVKVTVKDAPAWISLATGGLSMGIGESYQMKANLPEGSVSPIYWSSNKVKIASVDANGVITARKKGTAKITATTYNGRRVTCKVTVAKAPSAIWLSAANVTLGYGDSMWLGVGLTRKTASNITFTSSRPEIATVENGLITVGNTRGSTVITAETFNHLRASCTVNVVPAPDSLTMEKELHLGVKQGASLNTVLSPAGTAATMSYVSSNPKVVAVNGAGWVTAKKAGYAVIYLRTHNGLEASCGISVTKAPKKMYISAKKATIGAGQTLQLSAWPTGGTVTPVYWSSNNGYIATVDGEGRVTAHAAGKVKITAKSYNNKKVTCTITVTGAPTAVYLSAETMELGSGGTGWLGVGLNPGSVSPITFTSDNPSVAKVENGLITAGAGTGSAKITAETYNGVKASCTVNVVPAPESIELGADQVVKRKKSIWLSPELPEGTAATLSYYSSNPKIATVDATGKVTGKKKGVAIITVQTHNGKTDTCVVTVTK